MAGAVVVGVDGSDSSMAAAALAAREARMRGVPLRVVNAYLPPALQPPLVVPDAELRSAAEQLVSDVVAGARLRDRGVEVVPVAAAGPAVSVLEEESRQAGMVVVGNRGRGAFGSLLVGSTGVALAAHAHGPVLVVRGRGEPDGPVVVGVDGSEAGGPAVDFAFAEAALRRTGVRAVHAWTSWNTPAPLPEDPSGPYAAKPGELASQEERLLAETLSGRRERHPDVTVETRTVRGETRQALLDAAEDAQLVVVGSRGRGGFTGLLLGSVSQAMLHHATCPVAVVPHTR